MVECDRVEEIRMRFRNVRRQYTRHKLRHYPDGDRLPSRNVNDKHPPAASLAEEVGE